MNEYQESVLPEYVVAVEELHEDIDEFGDVAEKPINELRLHEFWAARHIINAAIKAETLLRQFHDWQQCPHCGKSYNANQHPQYCPHCKFETAPF